MKKRLARRKPAEDRRAAFVREYLIDHNATQAAIRAGYSKRSAYSQGQRLLKHADVAIAVAEAQAKLQDKTEIDAERIERELSHVAFSDISDIIPKLKDLPEWVRRAIASVKVRRYTEGKGDNAKEVEVVEFRLWSKLDAIEKLLKRKGLLVERHEHTGKDGKPIETKSEVTIYIPENDRERK